MYISPHVYIPDEVYQMRRFRYSDRITATYSDSGIISIKRTSYVGRRYIVVVPSGTVTLYQAGRVRSDGMIVNRRQTHARMQAHIYIESSSLSDRSIMVPISHLDMANVRRVHVIPTKKT